MGAYIVPWAWAAHPLFAVDPGDRIVLHEDQLQARVEGSAGNTLGPANELIPWPKVRRTDGTVSDLSTAQDPGSAIGDKIFIGPCGPADSWAALERLRLGLRITVRFDPKLTPYLGLWLCYGGWPETPGPKQVCVALEPTTANEDSLASAARWSQWLDPGETVTWPMELHIDRIATPSQSPIDTQEEYT
jgi:galactose mutarotase-like enzyme